MRNWRHRRGKELKDEFNTEMRCRWRLRQFNLRLRKSRATGGYTVYDPKGLFIWGKTGELPLSVVDEFTDYLMLREKLPGSIRDMMVSAMLQSELNRRARMIAIECLETT